MAFLLLTQQVTHKSENYLKHIGSSGDIYSQDMAKSTHNNTKPQVTTISVNETN